MANKEKKAPKGNFNIKDLGGILFSKMAKGGASRLRSNTDEVNKLNVFPVPDGDTGDNMRMTIESGIAAIENIDSDDLAEVMKTLSHGMLLGARGNSGVILSQFFAGMSKGLSKSKTADPATFAHALELGVEQAYSSVMTPTEGTILTVAREAVEYAVANLTPKSTIRSLFADLVKEMHESLDRTPEILAVLKEAGVVDSGGAGLLYIMEGFNRVLNGEEATDEPESVAAPAPKAAAPTVFAFNENSEMTYGYCTELLLQLQRSKTDVDNFDVDALRAFLASVGDSVVAFKTESIVKLHVHTFTPEKVLEYGRKFGEFLTVKIENMSVQHTELESNEGSRPEAKETAPAKKYGIVAVSNGPGVTELFMQLGTDVVVPGGQTQNPSTRDFIEAFEQISAEHIFVFPNNSNIFMAAQQAGELHKRAQVHVIPSKNIGTGYVAISSANLDNPDVDAVICEMEEAMKCVSAGYVSPSIRDAEISGIHIKNGDTMGIIDKEIVVSESDRMSAVKALASKLLELPDKFMLTVFAGADSAETEQNELTAYLSEKYSDAEVYFIDGGQEIYPYIFVAE
ncbi:MAG: DAK2 domain-containing protein [Clostridia bacterium]|nr:DAK2 domain-containing protein [Clostridia bacterium]